MLYYKHGPAQLIEEFSTCFLRGAPVMTPPPFSEFEFLERYATRVGVRRICRMQTNGNELQAWHLLIEHHGMAVAGWAQRQVWLGRSSTIEFSVPSPSDLWLVRRVGITWVPCSETRAEHKGSCLLVTLTVPGKRAKSVHTTLHLTVFSTVSFDSLSLHVLVYTHNYFVSEHTHLTKSKVTVFGGTGWHEDCGVLLRGLCAKRIAGHYRI